MADAVVCWISPAPTRIQAGDAPTPLARLHISRAPVGRGRCNPDIRLRAKLVPERPGLKPSVFPTPQVSCSPKAGGELNEAPYWLRCFVLFRLSPPRFGVLPVRAQPPDYHTGSRCAEPQRTAPRSSHTLGLPRNWGVDSPSGPGSSLPGHFPGSCLATLS